MSTSDAGGELEVRAWTPAEAAVPEVFAFPEPEREGLVRPRTEAQWDWAFRRNPAGTRLFLARRAGRPVAAFGALPVRVRAFGEPRVFDALLDPLLAPDEPEETLLACAQALLEAHAGPQADMLVYGWPAGRWRALAQARLGFELLTASALLVCPLSSGPSALPAGVEELARFEPEVDALYAACAPQWGASAVRDAAFLNWRFAENPFRRHRLLGLREGATWRGLAVFRPGPELHPGLGLLMELLVQPGDEQACGLLIEAARALARAAGLEALGAVAPEWSPLALELQERGFRHHPSEHLLYVRGSLPRFDMLYLREHWWTSLADALIL